MRIATLFAGALLALLALAGCAGVEPQRYAAEKPALDLRRYFDGTLVGHGMVLDRGGAVTRRFVVTIKASWVGDTGTLDEDFAWSDGEKERRVWTLKPGAVPGRWLGTAADVVGQAQGTVAGNALNWRYPLVVTTKEGRRFTLDFDDWMFLIDERVLMNRAVMSFWGWRVGEVLIAFDRKP